MIKRPSFPLERAVDPSLGRRFDHQLVAVVLGLVIMTAVALLVHAAAPVGDTPSDPESSVVMP